MKANENYKRKGNIEHQLNEQSCKLKENDADRTMAVTVNMTPPPDVSWECVHLLARPRGHTYLSLCYLFCS